MDARAHERGREVRTRLLIGAFAAAAASATSGIADASQVTGRLLVTLDRPHRTTAHAAAAHAIAAHAGAIVVPGRSVPAIGLVTVRAPAGLAPHVLAARLRAQPGVAHVEAEHRASLRFVPNDPGLVEPETAPGTTAGTPIQWWVAREGFPGAWDVTRGTGATVAVIDTGADAGHPEIGPKITKAIDLDDNPGHGAATTDEAGHGTHVASLACAATDDAVSIVGAGFGCSLIVIKTDLSDSSVAKSIVAAVDNGADAVNMSFGTDGSQPAARAVSDAIDNAFNRGAVLVSAAADEPTTEQGDPPNVLQPTNSGPDITQGKGLSVTAANANDARASFAGFGTQISIAAYGAWQVPGGGPRGLLGAFPGNETELERGSLTGGSGCNCRVAYAGDGRYAYLQGTSMAAPQVAAAAALVKHLNPDLSAADVIRLLKTTARRPSGTWTADLGWGILDAGSAVAGARLIDRRAPKSKVSAPSSTHKRSITLRITSTDTAPAGCVASGRAKVRVYRRVAKGHFTKIATTTRSTLKVRVRPGSTYGFYAVGVDKAGNVEKVPPRVDVRVRVLT